MTARSDFTPEEWKLVLEGPPSAALLVIMAQRGGTFRETFAIGKGYAEARAHHGDSELLDEIVAAKPEVDHTRYHSVEELRGHVTKTLADAVALLSAKATSQEVADYRAFVVALAERVGRAHSEGGEDPISAPEHEAIETIKTALG